MKGNLLDFVLLFFFVYGLVVGYCYLFNDSKENWVVRYCFYNNYLLSDDIVCAPKDAFDMMVGSIAFPFIFLKDVSTIFLGGIILLLLFASAWAMSFLK